jgi:hypothetical protein
MALLSPGISIMMVAEGFPESRNIIVHELDPSNPFRAFPKIEMWNEEPGRAPVLRLEIRPVEAKSDPRLSVEKILQGQVDRVVAV